MSVALSFVTPPAGLEPHVDFVLAPVDGADGLYALRATGEPMLRLYLADPAMVVDDYRPELSDDQVALLGLASPADALVLVVVRRTDDGVCVNLMAPVIVNVATGTAAQPILEDQGYPVHALLA